MFASLGVTLVFLFSLSFFYGSLYSIAIRISSSACDISNKGSQDMRVIGRCRPAVEKD